MIAAGYVIRGKSHGLCHVVTYIHSINNAYGHGVFITLLQVN